MAREIKNYDYCTFNELVERPVDIFYCDKTEIISISFSNLPDTKCNSNKVWKDFLQDTWDDHLPEMDNILDFMRYVIYHTGLVGRFYKINCILSLDDIFPLLKDRLPNPEACFRTWHNLHKVARLVLEETYKNCRLNVSLNLDLHTRTNSACDNSDVKIKFLNAENLPNEHELVLIYHITACYRRNDQIVSTRNSNQSHLDSFSNISDNSKEFNGQHEVAKESKSISCQIQSGSNDVDDWQKYGARPKNKSYSVKNYNNATSNLKEYEISNQDKRHYEQHTYRKSERENLSETRRMSQNRSRLFEKVACTEKRMSEHFREGDSLANSVENSKTFPIFDELSLPPYPGSANSKERYSSLNNKENSNTCSASTPSVLVSPLAAAAPSTYDLLFPAPYIPITSEDNTLRKNDDAIGKDYGNCSRENPEKGIFRVMDMLHKASKGIKEQIDHHSRDSPDVNSLELDENEKRLDTAEAKIRALKAPYESLLLSIIRPKDEFPVSTPDNNAELHISASQHDSSFQLPHISLQSENVHKGIAGGDYENSNHDMNIDENFLRFRENILRHEVKIFFENNFPVASCDVGVFPVKTETSYTVKERGNISPLSPDFQFDRLLLVDPKRSPESVNATAASRQNIVSSHDDPNQCYFAIEKFDDKISFRWKNVSDRQASSSMRCSDPILLQDTSAEKSLKNLENEKLSLRVTDKEPDDIDAIYAKFFEELTQNLPQNPSLQKMSPRHSENLQLSPTHKNHSTLEKKSEHVEVLESACSEKTDDQAKLILKEEKLSNLSDESLNLSDIDYELDYELDYGSSSEIEQ